MEFLERLNVARYRENYDNTKCLMRYKTFKECREYVLKRHFVCNHFNINNLNAKDREETFNRKKKTTVFEELKGGLEKEEISESKRVLKLRMEISNLVSFKIFTKDDGFTKQFLKKFGKGLITLQKL